MPTLQLATSGTISGLENNEQANTVAMQLATRIAGASAFLFRSLK